MKVLKLGSVIVLGAVIAIFVGIFVMLEVVKVFFPAHFMFFQNLFPSISRNMMPRIGPVYKGEAAKLPCLANKQCPVGQSCSGGFCSEGFMAPVLGPAVDMSSCSAKECKGINAPCSRKAQPCPEGTFCQNDSCVNIAAPSQGEAYNQIGTLLN